MKKWISILCVMLLLGSAMTMAVSAAAGTAEDPIVCTGLNFNMVKIPAGATYYVSFTDTSGAAKRQISINSGTDKEAGYAVTYGDVLTNSDENGYCNVVVAPDANGTFFFSITNNSANQATFFVNFYDVSPYEISDTYLFEGENPVTTLMADTTLFAFEPEEAAIYEVAVDKADALLSQWGGSVFYVTGLEQEAIDGKFELTCTSVGQTFLIGLSGVDAANITVTKVDEYIPPAAIEYVEYVNKHTPDNNFQLPEGELIAIDITQPQTVVLGADSIYHYGTVDGPVVYVDMTGVTYADLYACFYPTSGEKVDRIRGTYIDADGNTCGYEFLTAMQAYADALDTDGFYYLTEDLANYLQMHGTNQGWYIPEYSPFEIIKTGNFNADSAWLVAAYYLPSAGGDEPIIPDEPDEPDTPVDPEDPTDPEEPTTPDEPVTPDDPTEEPDSPATGDASAFGAVAALLLSSVGALTLRKKRN